MKEKYRYRVCVRCFTFNQAKYIKDTMDGFVKQKTDFPFVCLIIDDNSTDGEQIVIEDYLKCNFEPSNSTDAFSKETNDYRFILSTSKLNPNCSFAILYLKYNHYNTKKDKLGYVPQWLDSDYIAYCEGDDYWTDPNKLQIQVNELIKHKDVDLTAHATIRMKGVKIHGIIRPQKGSGIIPVETVIERGGGLFATNSLLFRKEALETEMNFDRQLGLDYFLQIKGSLRGGALYIDKPCSVYRETSAGSWSSKLRSDKTKVLLFHKDVRNRLDMLNSETNNKYNNSIKKRKLYLEFEDACVIDNWREIKSGRYKDIIKGLSLRRKVQLYLNHYASFLVPFVSETADIIRTVFEGKKYNY